MPLTSFAFEHDGCFLLPLEELSPRGISGELANAIAARGLLSKGAIELFDAALACLHDRLSAMHAAAPDSHAPPRLLNVLVITAAETTRPFFQPLPDMSAALYAAEAGIAQALDTPQNNGTPDVPTTSLADSSLYPNGQPLYKLDPDAATPLPPRLISTVLSWTQRFLR